MLCLGVLLYTNSFSQVYDSGQVFYDSAFVYFKKQDYVSSAKFFEKSATYPKFNTLGVRYNAACAWAKANMPDNAFYQLDIITNGYNFKNHSKLETDKDLFSLHNDRRWNNIVSKVKENYEKDPNKIDKKLEAELKLVYQNETRFRLVVDSLERIYGFDSEIIAPVIDSIRHYDSINQKIVSNILDNRGWLGPKIVGREGAMAIFLVIQHSDLATQKKYLPIIEKAANTGEADYSFYAYLIDRIRKKEGKKQIYGTQTAIDSITKKYVIYPIEDEKNVNERRLKAGLSLLEDYAKLLDIMYEPK